MVMLSRIFCFLSIFLFVLPVCGNEYQPITSKNWTNHPQIKEIREIYKDVKYAIEEKQLKKSQREFEYCQPYQDTTRIMYTNKRGIIRNYYYKGGSDDSTISRDYYYDERGQIRFGLITGGAANGTKIEHRIYFDKNGRRIWEIQKLLKGPGYFFPTEWPDEDIIRKPKEAFYANNPCKEKP